MHSHLHHTPVSRQRAWRRLSALLVSLLLTAFAIQPTRAALPARASLPLTLQGDQRPRGIEHAREVTKRNEQPVRNEPYQSLRATSVFSNIYNSASKHSRWDLAALDQSAALQVMYVDHDATGANNGTSWVNAYTDVQSALAVAQPGAEIWIAEGIYTPGAARTDTFTLRPGVALYGGFAGTETQRTERDWTAHVTVLSGDLDHNDRADASGVVTTTAAITGTNAYHVVSSSGLTQTATLDGFTITAGQANDSSHDQNCAGMDNRTSAPTIANLIFSGNQAVLNGGGMCNWATSTPTLTNVTFIANKAAWGGGMLNDHSSPTLTNVTFKSNQTDSGGGGGMFNFYSSPVLTNVTFRDNRADWGGGMRNDWFNKPVLTNVTFIGNQAVGNGGGMFSQYSNQITLTNVLFDDNLAGQGAGMFNVYNTNATLNNVTFSRNQSRSNDGGLLNRGTSTSKVVNSILWGNVPNQVQDDDNGGVSITYSDVQGGYTGVGNLNADPRFVDAAHSNLDLQQGSPAIDSGDPNRSICPATDVRGQSRRDGHCDMGAYEAVSSSSLLALYVLAFDNSPRSPTNLSAYYPETMQALIDATSNRPDLTVLVLADLDGPNTTRLYEVHNGVATRLSGLPNAGGTLDPALYEYDTTNGTSLGGFITWARRTYPAARTTFSYIGHDAPLPPKTAFSSFGSTTLAVSSNLFPLPFHKGADPDFTDTTSRQMLSTYDLAEALRIGTNDGASPLDVVDLLNCFGLSIETLYPLRSFARAVTGSPNYAYFAPELPGAALRAIQPRMSPTELASALVQAYDTALPPTEHPRLLVAIDTSQLTAIKQAWDAVSLFLWQGLTDPATAANYRAKLIRAYTASQKYDTTFCAPQDWELAPPDALVDLRQFADQLRLQFGELSDIGIAASDTVDALSLAVITNTHHNGTPWFAAPQTPTWNFDGTGGISLYADLVGTLRSNSTVLSWQAHWYTETVTLDNPHPYTFIASSAYGVTWADVFATFWAGQGTLQTEACLPTLPPVRETGELTAGQVLSPLAGTVRAGSPVTITVSLSTQQVAHNPLVGISVTQNNTVVFTDTVGVGYLRPGTYAINASKPWTPTAIGPFTISFSVDADHRVIETNEANNTGRATGTVLLPGTAPRPIITAQTLNQQQWITSTTVGLQITQVPATAPSPATQVHRLVVEVYQYRSGDQPSTQLPVKIDQQIVDPINLPLTNFALTLPSLVRPGPILLYVWPRSMSGGLGDPAIVRFNYVPPSTSLGANETHYFRFNTNAGDQVQLNLAISTGNARLSVWEPDNYWSAMTISGSGGLPLIRTLAGEYVVSVEGMQPGTQYTLNATRGTPAVPLSEPGSSMSVQTVTQSRPAFVEPLPIAPIDLRNAVYLPSIAR